MNYGFVKVMSKNTLRRIGRYIEDDETGKKAKVCFGYECDTITQTNYKYYAHSSLSNNITKQDLVDRYFDITKALEQIEMRAHQKIKKYSAEHTSLITECNMIRSLMLHYFSLSLQSVDTYEENIMLFGSFKDQLWINDFMIDLELSRYHISLYNHEMPVYFDQMLKETTEKCMHVIFILSKEAMRSSSLLEEYHYLKERDHRIYLVSLDKRDYSQFDLPVYYLGALFSDPYKKGMEQLLYQLSHS